MGGRAMNDRDSGRYGRQGNVEPGNGRTGRWRGTFLLFGFLALAGCALSAGSPGALVPATVKENPSLKQMSIEVAGRRRSIHYRTWGDPSHPVLFVLHGSLSDMRAYLPLSVFSDRYFVVMWDLRGNGLSERVTREELAIEAMVEEIKVMKEHFAPGRRVTIMGHSWSAVFVALFIGRFPDDVQQAVLMEPFGLRDSFMSSVGQSLNLLTPEYMDMMYSRQYLSALNHELLDYAMLAVLNGRVRDFFCQDAPIPPWPVWRVGGLALIVWESSILDGGRYSYDFTDDLASFPRKVLLVGSSCSPIGYRFQERFHVPLFREVEVLRIENSGHRIVTEQLDQLIAGLHGYLELYP